MIRLALKASVAAVVLFASNAVALTTEITDTYHGGTANNPNWLNQDIIGLPEHWDVSKMVVDIDEATGEFVIDIYSQFFDNVGRRGVELGDLFISVDGWNPFGTAPYDSDDYTNGEDWELVAVLDDHGEGVTDDEGESYLGKSGELSLYKVETANIELSDLPGGDHRVGQEVQYNAGQQEILLTGRWSIFDAPGAYDVLRFYFQLDPKGLASISELGFHWSMTCGNDVIEGVANVPEPTTVALMGMGLLGMLPRARRSKK